MSDLLLSIGHQPITARQVGVLCHRAIGQLLADGRRAPQLSDITDAANPLLAVYHGPTRQAARVQVISAVGMYFRHFLPPAPWKLEDVEVSVPGARLDLLFGHPCGARFSDEVKTGRVGQAIDQARLGQQVERAWRGARRTYGECFVGVRALILGHPFSSFGFAPEGGSLPSVEVMRDA